MHTATARHAGPSRWEMWPGGRVAVRGHRPRAIVLAGTGYGDPPSYTALVDELRRYEAAGGWC